MLDKLLQSFAAEVMLLQNMCAHLRLFDMDNFMVPAEDRSASLLCRIDIPYVSEKCSKHKRESEKNVLGTLNLLLLYSLNPPR